MSTRNERLAEILRDLGARFLVKESSKASLITVTKVELTKDGKYATIFFTVFSLNPPKGGSGDRRFSHEQFEKTALEFAKRKRSEFKEFIKENSRLGRIPQLDFAIDLGEKNRQMIDSLLG